MTGTTTDGWSQVEKRLAFYAGILKHRKLQVPPDVAQRWRSALPGAIELEYERIDRGELPRALTTAVVLGDDGSAPTTPPLHHQPTAPEWAPGSG